MREQIVISKALEEQEQELKGIDLMLEANRKLLQYFSNHKLSKENEENVINMGLKKVTLKASINILKWVLEND